MTINVTERCSCTQHDPIPEYKHLYIVTNADTYVPAMHADHRSIRDVGTFTFTLTLSVLVAPSTETWRTEEGL